MDTFEKENWLQASTAQQKVEGGETDEVRPFHSFAEVLAGLNIPLPLGHCLRVYEASAGATA